MTLVEKLHPKRFTDMSPKMAAIVGCILGESWTTPGVTDLSITSDGCVVCFESFIGSVEDFDRNIENLLVAADLTNEERKEFDTHYNNRVTDWRV